jgi:zinc transport system ATP-binding protein
MSAAPADAQQAAPRVSAPLRGYLIGGVGASMDLPQAGTTVSAEIAENVHPDVQVYVTASFADNVMSGQIIGYVPQSLDFDRSLPITVRDFLAMTTQRRPVFLGVSRARRAEIDRTLARLGLAGKLTAKLGSLSGGERQRVLLAQALIPEPALLVLDEPTTGLDVAGKEILENTIVEFVRAGGTAVWINHDIGQVSKIADAVTYVDRKVLLDGAPRDVLASGTAARLFPSLALAGEAAAS